MKSRSTTHSFFLVLLTLASHHSGLRAEVVIDFDPSGELASDFLGGGYGESATGGLADSVGVTLSNLAPCTFDGPQSESFAANGFAPGSSATVGAYFKMSSLGSASGPNIHILRLGLTNGGGDNFAFLPFSTIELADSTTGTARFVARQDLASDVDTFTLVAGQWYYFETTFTRGNGEDLTYDMLIATADASGTLGNVLDTYTYFQPEAGPSDQVDRDSLDDVLYGGFKGHLAYDNGAAGVLDNFYVSFDGVPSPGFTSGETLLVDFGKAGQETVGNWNNVSENADIRFPAGTAILKNLLVRNSDGIPTSVRLVKEEASGSNSGIGSAIVGPVGSPDGDFASIGRLPDSAQEDMMFIQSPDLTLAFDGLDDGLTYRLEVFSKIDASRNAHPMVVQSGLAAEQSALVEPDVAPYAVVFENVPTDGNGRIALSFPEAGFDGATQHLNAVALTAMEVAASPLEIVSYDHDPSSGESTLVFSSEAGANYSLWGGEDLASPVELLPLIGGTGLDVTVTHTPAGSPVRYFYQVRKN